MICYVPDVFKVRCDKCNLRFPMNHRSAEILMEQMIRAGWTFEALKAPTSKYEYITNIKNIFCVDCKPKS